MGAPQGEAQIAYARTSTVPGGGIQITNGSLLDMVAIQSMPTLGPSNVPTGWYARGSNVDSNNDNAGTVDVRAYAICASP